MKTDMRIIYYENGEIEIRDNGEVTWAHIQSLYDGVENGSLTSEEHLTLYKIFKIFDSVELPVVHVSNGFCYQEGGIYA
jgi:hypothetical protein